MNKVILMGRMARDPDVRYPQDPNGTAVARFTLAVDRRMRKEANSGEQTADFVSCVAFGKTAEFLERYGHKGTKFVLEGRIQTGSYTNKDGQRVYTTDVVTENIEFAESKGSTGIDAQQQPQPKPDEDGFMNIPEGIDEELPFD